MIKRSYYIEKIKPFINKKLIKVLTGQRRVGKSSLLQLIKKEISAISPKANIIFIDKEKYEFDHIREHVQLMDYINSHRKKNMNYLFIDEIQDITGFEKVLRSLYSEKNFDIYCTGSNSNIFSSELSTLLSGRQIAFHIGSLNFNEFCMFHNLKEDNNALQKYLKYGGLPYLMHLPDDEQIRFEYLNNINATILYRDVVNRNQIRDPRFLNDLLKFLADNICSLFSANKISEYLKNQHIKKNVPLILDYIGYLEQAYFINKVERYDIQGKRHFEIGEKYYFEDIGLRNAIIGYNPADVAKIIENIVFLHLKHCGYKIQIGIIDNKEIDFIAAKDGEINYFQVTYLLSDKSVIEREFGNLLAIKDNYPKYVISLDTLKFKNTFKGIKHLSLLEFLKDFK